jgi:hypothetical protein
METESKFTFTPARIPPLIWDEQSKVDTRNLQITWLTRRFGLSPTFARRVAELAFERRPGR